MFRSAFLASCVLLLASFPALSSSPPIPDPPTVDARSYILVDANSGAVLAENRADERVEPASLTKLMTAYAVFLALREGRLKLDEPVTISQRAWRAEGSRTFVQVGTQVPVEVLIRGMIVQSGNDATIALAERVAGTEDAFVQLMNEYARRLGMKNTNFENSPGLPGPSHLVTARDMAILATAIVNEFPEYYRWYSEREFTWNNIRQQNRNGLLARDPSVDGMKTGHTSSAGYCLVTSARRDGMRLISVVIGSKTIRAREDASAALLNYGYTFYESVKVSTGGEALAKPRVYKSAEEYGMAGSARDLFVTVPRGQGASLVKEPVLREPFVAPLAAGDVMGELTVRNAAGEVLAREPLVALQPANEGGFFTRAWDSIAILFH
jgi:serine-type D-Ala-D-Ala carboxypeptidase (penicillin-binding protein 5/6)